MIILATDSGLERTGYAFFEKNSHRVHLTSFGIISTKKDVLLQQRLKDIFDKLEALIEKKKPKIIVIERLFFFMNQKTAITVAQTQGILLVLAAKYGMAVEFLAPLAIKKILTGYGRADKKLVQKKVKKLLHLTEIPKSDDVVDAMACGIAFCYLQKWIV